MSTWLKAWQLVELCVLAWQLVEWDAHMRHFKWVGFTAIFGVAIVIVGPASWVVCFGLDCIKDM
jgi:hypothetical protein